MQAVDVRHVGYRITTGLFSRPRWLLREVSFSLPTGRSLALIGANGAGKTTLLKTLLGTLRPHTGEALLFGRPGSDPAARTKMGFMPERSPFAPTLRAGEVMLQHARLAGRRGHAATQEVADGLARVGLGHAARLFVGALSKGMLQRLVLAQALLGRPRLLILDEPMSGLDPEGRLLVRDLLLVQRSLGTTLLFSSHALADVELLADTVVVMDQGCIVQQGSTRHVLEASAGGLEIVAYGNILIAQLHALMPECRIQPHAQHTICEVPHQQNADRAIDMIRQAGGHILSVARRPPGVRAPEDIHA